MNTSASIPHEPLSESKQTLVKPVFSGGLLRLR